MGDEGEHEISLEFTPTLVMAAVFSVFAIISFIVENISLFFRKLFDSSKNNIRVVGGVNNNDNQVGGDIELVENNNNNNNNPGGGGNNNNQPQTFSVIIKAHRKIIEELAVAGFIGLIMFFSEDRITKICIPRCLFDHMLPCSRAGRLKAKKHFCSRKDMVPLLSPKDLREIEFFLFLLVVLHIILSVITVFLGNSRINRLNIYSDGKVEAAYRTAMNNNSVDFEATRNGGLFRLKVFGRSIFRSVTQSDYMILKYGFCVYKANFAQLTDRDYFRLQMIRANIDYFKQIGGISFYLWVFAIILLLLNVQGWHAYFWIAIIPIIPLILMGAILENIVTQLAIEISEVYVKRNDETTQLVAKAYWFNNCPDFILLLIHFIIFQTAFQMATFVWTLATYGSGSCMMGQLYYTLPRLFFGVCTLGLCGYSTLPLYTIVTQLGNEFNWEKFLEKILHGHDHYE